MILRTNMLLYTPMKRNGLRDDGFPPIELTVSGVDLAVDMDSRSTMTCKGSQDLESFTPKPFDVLLGRGRWYASHAGNQRLQFFISMYLERYQATKSRPEKTHITNEILHMVKTCGKQPGRFLKFDEEVNGWVAVSDEVARLKISQAMRYTIRTPQDAQGEEQPQGIESDANQLRQSSSTSSAPINLSKPATPTNGVRVVKEPSNPEMQPPPPRVPSNTVPTHLHHFDDYTIDESEGYDEDYDYDAEDDGKILSDAAIWRSLGYAPPFFKKRRSTG